MSMSKFHDHLDACTQCREHPFALCEIGAAFMKEEAKQILERVRVPSPIDGFDIPASRTDACVAPLYRPERRHYPGRDQVGHPWGNCPQCAGTR